MTTSELLSSRAPVPPADLDVALTAHAAVVRLLRTLHADVTGVARPYEHATVQGLEQHPVAVLGKLLRRHPDHPTLAVSDVVATHPTAPATALWRDLGRHAALALEEWHAAPVSARATDAQRWSDVADVAALSEALPHLDCDLAGHLARAGRPGLADEFADAAQSGVASAAREVRHLATAGPTPPAPDLPASVTAVVVTVRRNAEVPAAAARISKLIQAASELSPVQVQLIARVLAGAALRSAETLQRLGVPEHTPLAAALREQARALADVASAPRRVVSLAPSEPQALAQAHQIHDQLLSAVRNGQPLTEWQSLSLAGAVGSGATALATAVERQVETRRWVAPVEGADAFAPQWGRVRLDMPPPELVRAARVAGQRGDDVRALRSSDQPMTNRWPAAREVLSTALAHRDSTVRVRPEHPSAAPRHVR